MKKTSLILSLALAIVACQQEELMQPEVASSADDFVASVEDYSSATKTSLNEHNCVIWSENDQISIFNGSHANSCYQLKNEYIDKGNGVFSLASEGVDTGEERELAGNLAIYPYQENLQAYQIYNDLSEPVGIGVSGFEIPERQTYQENSFANGAFPMVAITKNKNDHNLKFRNLVGILKIELLGSIKVSEIQLRGANGESLSGKFSIESRYDNMIPTLTGEETFDHIDLDCGEGVQLNKNTPTSFYIAVVPTCFEHGFIVRVKDSDGYYHSKHASQKNTIERSAILSMPPFQTGGRVEVSTDFVSIPNDGSPVTLSVTATEDWEISHLPSWVQVVPSSGPAGTTDVSISMISDYGAYHCVYTHVDFQCDDRKFIVTVLKDRPITTCADVITNGIEGEEPRLSGYVTSINNTKYGNWYLTDETGSLYIYGTTKAGKYNFYLEEGDYVTLQGPKKIFGTTIELVDATLISVEKPWLKFISMDHIEAEGGEFKIRVECAEENAENNMNIIVPEDAQSWISVSSCNRAYDNYIDITITVTANTDTDRTATIGFELFKDGSRLYRTTEVHQAGPEVIKKVTIAEFLAAPVSSFQKYELTGTIESIVNTTYGNFYITDETGRVYVYGLTTKGEIGSNDKSFASIGLKEGDKVTLVGLRAEYNGSAQVGSSSAYQAYYVSHLSN